jgi:hypothetical protein
MVIKLTILLCTVHSHLTTRLMIYKIICKRTGIVLIYFDLSFDKQSYFTRGNRDDNANVYKWPFSHKYTYNFVCCNLAYILNE